MKVLVFFGSRWVEDCGVVMEWVRDGQHLERRRVFGG